jgi:very-short-patch-repair endonuclease
MLHYNPRLKHLARALRKQSTLSEVLLWQHLTQIPQLEAGFGYFRVGDARK